MTPGATTILLERGARPVHAGGLAAEVKPLPARARWLATWQVQLAICLVFALILRAPSFGDPNLHVDETFYFLVGQEMHKGALPYVDIWDRKPLGLFLIYYLIAGISHSVYAYQIVAWLFAATTGFVVTRIAALWTAAQGALLAGLTYLCLLLPLLGVGGQSPVFYNLPMAIAAWAIACSLADLRRGSLRRRIYLAMALCGVAISIKQTAFAESVFFGAYTVALLWRARVPWPSLARFVLVACALGAAPMLAIAACYALGGHWSEFWQAMVLSNLRKQHASWLQIEQSTLFVASNLALILAPAFLAIVLARAGAPFAPYRRFLVGWLLAATVGFFVVSNGYIHYALPLAVPLSVAAASFLDRPRWGPAVFALLLPYCLVQSQEWDIHRHRLSAERMEHLARTIRQHDDGTLLVFDGPPYLYAMTGARYLSPLVFPHHLNHQIEDNVSQLDTAVEIRRIVAARPGAVVIQSVPRNNPVNIDSRRVVLSYLRARCRLLDRQAVPEFRRFDMVLVYGDCHQPRPAGPSRAYPPKPAPA